MNKKLENYLIYAQTLAESYNVKLVDGFAKEVSEIYNKVSIERDIEWITFKSSETTMCISCQIPLTPGSFVATWYCVINLENPEPDSRLKLLVDLVIALKQLAYQL